MPFFNRSEPRPLVAFGDMGKKRIPATWQECFYRHRAFQWNKKRYHARYGWKVIQGPNTNGISGTIHIGKIYSGQYRTRRSGWFYSLTLVLFLACPCFFAKGMVCVALIFLGGWLVCRYLLLQTMAGFGALIGRCCSWATNRPRSAVCACTVLTRLGDVGWVMILLEGEVIWNFKITC